MKPKERMYEAAGQIISNSWAYMPLRRANCSGVSPDLLDILAISVVSSRSKRISKVDLQWLIEDAKCIGVNAATRKIIFQLWTRSKPAFKVTN